MQTTSNTLFDNFEGKSDLHPAIIHDLFGMENFIGKNEQEFSKQISLFLGLYKGLYFMNVSHQEIHRCFTKNKLDELIHTKYLLHPNKYYKVFCENKMKIGNTFIVDDNKSNNEANVYEDENEDYVEPYIYSQIQPPYHFMENSITQMAKICLGNLDEIISYKINEYKKQDKIKQRKIRNNYVSVGDVKKLLFQQENKCYVCGDVVLTEQWQTRCLYQFTLDRIDNTLPHNRNNVLICCYYCNCVALINCNNKLCPNKCHTIKRNIKRKKDDVSKLEMERLKLI